MRERNRNKTFLIHTEYGFRFWSLKRGQNCFTIRTELQVKNINFKQLFKKQINK